ncbi:hypothetical protein [uncultured Eudoraea sp.]|uniref:hypothetical protein n=1 Tax=uncultured Eudoraea sp. TaxID=1035614 RepID=UPI00262E097D|nr:hypothetical protein [uncultured Eudoraea sp.]
MTLVLVYLSSNTAWHFPLMILASLLLFLFIIRIVIGKTRFKEQFRLVLLLSFLLVVLGMLFGKYGAQWGLPWWIYYPIPMLMTLLLPPILLKLNTKRTIIYLFLSFLSAPFIHTFFSFFLGWTEYMPFWDIPYLGDL